MKFEIGDSVRVRTPSEAEFNLWKKKIKFRLNFNYSVYLEERWNI